MVLGGSHEAKLAYLKHPPKLEVTLNRATASKPFSQMNGDHLPKLLTKLKAESSQFSNTVRGRNANFAAKSRKELAKMFAGYQMQRERIEREQVALNASIVRMYTDRKRAVKEKVELRRIMSEMDIERDRRQKEMEEKLKDLEDKMERVQDELNTIDQVETTNVKEEESQQDKDIPNTKENTESSAQNGNEITKSSNNSYANPKPSDQTTSKSSLQSISEVKVLEVSKSSLEPITRSRSKIIEFKPYDEEIIQLVENVNTNQTVVSNDNQSQKLGQTSAVDDNLNKPITEPTAVDIITDADNVSKPTINKIVKQRKVREMGPRKMREAQLIKKALAEPFNAYRLDNKGELVALENLPMPFKVVQPSNREAYKVRKMMQSERRIYLGQMEKLETFANKLAEELQDNSLKKTKYIPRSQHSKVSKKHVALYRSLLPKQIDPQSSEATLFYQYVPKYGAKLAAEMIDMGPPLVTVQSPLDVPAAV